jgi:ATP-dependent helicase/nuclease subunit B
LVRCLAQEFAISSTAQTIGTCPIRHFLGWDSPTLPTAAAWLLDHAEEFGLSTPSPIASEVDLSSLLILLPGGRAARTLSSELLRLGRSRSLLLSLPRCVTPGHVVDRLFAVEGHDASAMAEQVALARALQAAPVSTVEDLLRRPLNTAPFASVLHDAELLAGTIRGLCGDDLLPEEVPGRLEALPASSRVDAALATFRAEQWHALQQIMLAARSLLHAAQLTYAPLRRLEMVRSARPTKRQQVVLIATPELPALVRRALLQHAASVTALIAAPAALSERFTSLGTLDCAVPVPARSWSGTLPVGDAELTMVGTPQEQAEAVFTHLATGIASDAGAGVAGAGPPSAAEIIIAVPDREVTAALETLSPDIAANRAVRVRAADPVPLARSAPAAVLQAALHFASERTLSSLCTLVAQPDMAVAIARLLPERDRRVWPMELDEYAAGCADRTLAFGGEESWPSRDAAGERTRRVLGGLLGAVDAILAPLANLSTGNPGTALAIAAQRTLSHVYAERTGSRSSFADRQLIAALRTLNALLTDLRQLPGPLQPPSAADASTLLHGELESATLSPEPDPEAIEVLGWLEAVIDPVPILIVTGVNDHCLPTPSPADAFLPDGLRGMLGLPKARDREVRDSYLLELARRTHRTHLICGRRSGGGDPLLPSRLVLQDPDTLAARILQMQEPKPLVATIARRAVACGIDGFPIRPILSDVPLPSKMSVTSFASYLTSPYGYYLRHVLRLQECEAPAAELSRIDFGDLIHQSLSRWAQSDAKDSSDADEIAAELREHLYAVAHEMLGRAQRVEVELQIRIALTRLNTFSQWQAERRRQGWRILATEWTAPAGSAMLMIPGQEAMPLTGRIDRVDINETGTSPTYAVIDYKTGDSPRTPDNPHRSDVIKNRPIEAYSDLLADGSLAAAPKWNDLQLPLYRHLVGALVPKDAQIELALLNLPRDPDKCGLEVLDAHPLVFASADAAARWVVRSIRARHFDDGGNSPPSDGTSALLTGVGLFSPQAAGARSKPESMGRGGEA